MAQVNNPALLNSIAILIDADNASAKTIDTVFAHIKTLGKISCKKIYGDWGQDNLKGWQAVILRHAIDPMQQFAHVKGKNATDIALVIEAMDLLNSGKYDGFCLVSSDSDFASLAVRIRKSGLPVYGFGRETAVESFRISCDRFFEVEKLGIATPPHSQPANTQKWDNKRLKQDTHLVNALKDSVKNALKDEEDWANYSQVANLFRKNYPQISIEHYGFNKLIHILQEIDIFSIKQDKDSSQLLIRYKAGFSTITKYTTQQLRDETQLIDTINQLIDINPKAENGWSKMSYIASQLNQNPQIDIKKYGYNKFSELMTAIRIFDIQKQANGFYIKRKQAKIPQTQPTQTMGTTATLDTTTQQPLILNHTIQILVETSDAIDTVVWRLTPDKKVRNDSDMIFYGQTHSEDNSMSLAIETTTKQTLLSEIDCNLAKQPSDIQRISVTLSHESNNLPSHQPMNVMIKQNNNLVFNGKFLIPKQTAQSMLLFELIKVATGWQFMPCQQLINGDLPLLCKTYGIEVSDD